MVKVLQNIKEKCLILKPDKGQGIILINKTDYYNSVGHLLSLRYYKKTQHYVICQPYKLIPYLI